MEELRDKLIESIKLNGRESEETVRLSQELDILIVKEMEIYKC
ncbi:aspartyl-phosphate phosphatase Spo0E family protein [Clostridium butyricum]